MACKNGVSLSAYCAAHPGYAGCTTAPLPAMPVHGGHLAHGLLLCLAWALLFPSGAMTPRFWKARWPTTWLKVHKILNLSAVALTLIGVVVQIVATQRDGSPHFAHTHAILGLTLTVAVAFQPVYGYLRPPKKTSPGRRAQLPVRVQSPSTRRVAWKWSHMLIGYGMIGIGVFQLISGIRLSWGLESLYGVYGGLFGLAMLWGLVGFMLAPKASAKAAEDAPPSRAGMAN